uniref:Putative secreted protein n=1 Tax=Ixodes ricinus TaxID=34613 RepID=A0A6B0TZR8_IXORI
MLLVFLWRSSLFLVLSGGLHKQGKHSPKPEDVHKLVAVVDSFHIGCGKVQDFQGPTSRYFLLPEHEVHELESLPLEETFSVWSTHEA